MSIVKEFKEFAVRGNVIDLAVGIIIGGAFGKIVSSLVGDVLMPPIGFLSKGVDFSKAQLVIQRANEATKIPEVAVKYGAFIQATLDFVIVAFCVFLLVKAVNRLKAQNVAPLPPAPLPVPPPAPTKEETLLTEIRDLLARR